MTSILEPNLIWNLLRIEFFHVDTLQSLQIGYNQIYFKMALGAGGSQNYAKIQSLHHTSSIRLKRVNRRGLPKIFKNRKMANLTGNILNTQTLNACHTSEQILCSESTRMFWFCNKLLFKCHRFISYMPMHKMASFVVILNDFINQDTYYKFE